MFEQSLDHSLPSRWDEMGAGAPTLIALAHLCSRAMIEGIATADSLSQEAKTILWTARQRGVFEVRGNNRAYESPSRFLTVYIELAQDRRMRFRSNTDPLFNIRFLDGFRQLCANGLVMHHLFHEFSLTPAGFDVAARIEKQEIEHLLQSGQECNPGG